MESIKGTAIIEILGRPAKNVLEALNLLVERIKSEKEIKLLFSNVHEPVPVKDAKDLFTSFAEVELEFKTLNNLVYFMFAYMPANLEISYPEKIVISNHDLNQLTNLLMHRLHQYDAVTKNVAAERDFLAQELYKFKPELFKNAQNFVPQNSILTQEKEKPKKKDKSTKKKKK